MIIPKKTSQVALFAAILITNFLSGYFCYDLLPFSPSAAVAIGSLFLFGNRYFTAVFLGALVTQLALGTALPGSIGLASLNTLEAVVGANLISYFLNKTALKNYNELIAVIIAALVASIFSQSWSGHFITSLIILPLILEIQNRKDLCDIKKIFIFIFINIVALVILYSVFLHNYNQAFAWFLCLPLLFSGLYLAHIFSRLTLLFLGLGIIFLSQKGFGSFDYGTINLNLVYIYILLSSYALATLFAKAMKSDLTENKKFIISLAFSWPIICSIIFIASANEHQAVQKDLNIIAEKTVDGIEENAADAVDLLIGASGLIVAQPVINTAAWNEYINSHLHSKTFQVVNGLGFIRPEAQGDNLAITLYGSRYTTQLVPGLDLSGEPTLKKAAIEARLANHTIASQTTQLLHDKTMHDSFILFHPIRTSDKTNKQFYGWIFAPVITEHFFNKCLELYTTNLFINIKEGAENIYKSKAGSMPKTRNPLFTIKKQLELYGKILNLDFYPKEEYFIQHSSRSVPVTGLVISIYFFITCFLVDLFSFGIRTEKIIHARTLETEEARKKLAASEKMAYLGEVASGMAHEINNPLSIITGRVQRMLSLTQEPTAKQELEKILINTEKISQLITSLRKFSGDSEKIHFEQTSIHKIINTSLALCDGIISKNKVEIKLNDLESIDDLLVTCNATQISQVIFHLINNSCDAIANFDTRWIQINTKNTDHQTIQIIVTDSGKGIPAEIADKLMQPFFTTKEVGIGKGIDLSTSHGILRDHKGSLTLDRQSPNTTFVIELPI
jgi:signal transduction histidine kinase